MTELNGYQISSKLIYGFEVICNASVNTTHDDVNSALEIILDKLYGIQIASKLLSGEGSRGVHVYHDGNVTDKSDIYIGVELEIAGNAGNVITIDPALKNIVDDYAASAGQTAGFNVITVIKPRLG